MAKTKKITPITGVGTTGYKVTFSVLDLYKMKQLAFELYQLDQVICADQQVISDTTPKESNSSLMMAFELLNGLFEATIGETNGDWDCFTEEEGV